MTATTTRHCKRERIFDDIEDELSGCSSDVSLCNWAWENRFGNLVDVLFSIIVLDVESVSGLVGDFELQVVDVLTVGIASWAIQAELGMEVRSVKCVTRG